MKERKPTDIKFDESDLDSFGNNYFHVLYESRLAQAILEYYLSESAEDDCLDLLCKMILKTIQFNCNFSEEDLNSNLNDKYKILKSKAEILERQARGVPQATEQVKIDEPNVNFGFIWNFLYIFNNTPNYPQMTFQELIDYLRLPANKLGKKIYAKFDVIKWFIEGTMLSAWILPESHLLEDDNKDNHEHITYERYIQGNRFRNGNIFSRRGRNEASFDRGTKSHAGIPRDVAAPSDLKNFFQKEIPNAAVRNYERDRHSETTKLFARNHLPFIGGASGTIAYLLTALANFFVTQFTEEEYKKLYMLFAAELVSLGHHSFAEVGMVVSNALGQHPGAFRILLPEEFDSSLSDVERAEKYYQQYLTEKFVKHVAYQKFLENYGIHFYPVFSWEQLRDAMCEVNDKRRVNDYTKEIDKDLWPMISDKTLTGEIELTSLSRVRNVIKNHTFTISDEKIHPGIKRIIKKLENAGHIVHRKLPDNFMELKSDEHDELGYTPVMYAVRYNQNNLLEKLLKNSFDPNSQSNNKGNTALHFAILMEEDRLSSIQLLLDNGANPNVLNEAKETPLELAIKKKNIPAIKLLLMKKELLSKTTLNNAMKLLHENIAEPPYNKFEELEGLLINAGATYKLDPNTQDSSGATLVEVAIKKRNVTALKRLLEKKDLLLPETLRRGLNVLFNDQYYTVTETLRQMGILLKNAGADFNAKDADVPFIFNACTDSRISTPVFYLMAHHSNLMVVNKKTNQRFLEYFFENQHRSSFSTQLKIHHLYDAFQPNQIVNQEGDPIFLFALKYPQDSPVYNYIKQDKSIVNFSYKDGSTILHRAAQFAARLPFLIQYGADVNARNPQGETPFMVFLKYDGTELKWKMKENVNAFLEAKMDLTAADNQGRTVMHHLATVPCATDYLHEFTKRKADINRQDHSGQTPLHIAAKKGDLEMVRKLHELGADPAIKNESGQTPIEMAKDHYVVAFLQNPNKVLLHFSLFSPSERHSGPNYFSAFSFDFAGASFYS